VGNVFAVEQGFDLVPMESNDDEHTLPDNDLADGFTIEQAGPDLDHGLDFEAEPVIDSTPKRKRVRTPPILPSFSLPPSLALSISLSLRPGFTAEQARPDLDHWLGLNAERPRLLSG
jgi:hypothetical protein